jgi:hypothetical protein
MKQNPFSLYDFMGYFIPGATAIYLIKIVNNIKECSEINLDSILTNFPSIKLEGILIFFIISYVLGHLLSYISSITTEKYAVWKYGYPSKYLLDMNTRKYWTGSKRFHSFFWRIGLLILLFPTVILDYVLGHFFGFKEFYSNKLDPMLIKLVTVKINKLLNRIGMNEVEGFNNGGANENDFNRLVMHYTYENSKNHQGKLTNYVAIYGFLRTLTLITNLVFWYIIFHNYFYSQFDYPICILLVTVSVISYLFFMAFMKFYRRYTLEGLMILAIEVESVANKK